MKKLLTLFISISISPCVLAQGTWVQKSDFLGTARSRAICFTIADTAYYGTGNYFGGANENSDMWKYIPASDMWIQITDFPEVMQAGVGLSVNNKGYAGIGWWGGTAHKEFYEYDPATDTWVQKSDYGGSLTNDAVAFSIDTLGYVGLGDGPFANPPLTEFYRYSATTDTWVQRTSFTGSARFSLAGFTINGKGYAGGGQHPSAPHPNDFYSYDPVTDTWVQIADYPGTQQGNARNSALVIGNTAYLATGDELWAYNSLGNTWTQDTTYPITTAVDAAFSINGKGYFLEVNTQNLWEYTPPPTQTYCLPVADYPFNGNANDESGNGNDGVVSGATLTADRFGNTNAAYNFDGTSSSYISVAHNSQFDFSINNKISLLLWIYPTAYPSASFNKIFISKQSGSGTSQTGFNCAFSNSSIGIMTRNGPGDNFGGISSFNAIPLNQWSHIAMVWDNGTGYFYLDDVLVQTGTSSSTVGLTTLDLLFGKANWSNINAEPFAGKMDNIKIYNCALDSAQIDSIWHTECVPIYATISTSICNGDSVLLGGSYQSTAGVYNDTLLASNGCDSIIITTLAVNSCSGSCLVASYSFNGNANDESGNGNNGVVNGATLTSDRYGNPNSAYNFDGLSTISIADNPLLQFAGERTLSFWMQIDSFPNDGFEKYIFYKQTGSGSNQTGFHALLSDLTNADIFAVRYKNGVSGMQASLEIPFDSIPLGQYNLFTWVVDADTSFLYLNSNVVVTGGGSALYEFGNNTNSLVIGQAWAGGFDNAFVGQFDDLKIFDCALGPNQIDSIYQDGTPLPTTCNLIVTTSSINATCGDNDGSAFTTVTGGTSPYFYQWTSGDTTAGADSLSAGVYVCTATDSSGCIETGVATISNSTGPSVTVDAVTDVSCSGGNDGAIDITVSGGTTPYGYSWSSGDTVEDLSGLQAGPYELQVEDAIGCIASYSIYVGSPASVMINATSVDAACGNTNGAASIVATGGTSPYTYNWSTGATNSSISGIGAGSYTVTITDANGCVDSAFAAVSETGAATIVVDSVIKAPCSGTGAIYISVSGGAIPYTYDWSTGATTEDVTGLAAGYYDVSVTESSSCVAVFNVEVEPEPLSIQEICLVTVDSITNVNVVVWEKPIATSVSRYNIYKESTQAGIYFLAGTVPYDSLSAFTDPNSNPLQRSWRYKITAVDQCGNESDFSPIHKTMHLTINPGLGNNYNLIWDHYTGFTFLSYIVHRYRPSTGWMIIDTIPSNIFTYTDLSVPQGPIDYNVETIHPDGCAATKQKNFNSSKSNTSSFEAPGPVTYAITSTEATIGNCDGTATITPSGGVSPYTYLWNDGQTASTAIGLCVGTYTVTVIDADGNSIQGSALISEATGIGGISVHYGVKVSPNPFSHSTTIEFANDRQDNLNLLIFDIAGKLVREYPNLSTSRVVVQRNGLGAGTYYYQLKGEQGVDIGKLVIL